MDYDVVIIGAGMSGLAAGIRLAYFEKNVCIVEQHSALGGLNSYYRREGRLFDVGLHAVTNYAPPERRAAPLPKLLRQLRLTREDFDLGEQRFSEVRFPTRTLRFTNDPQFFLESVAEQFPHDIDNFRRLLANINVYNDTRLDQSYQSARQVLGEFLDDPTLIDMLLCPVMYYGSAEENDMDYTQFVTIFKSLFCEGFARPRGGVRTIIKALVKKFRQCGGRIRLNTGVERINVAGGRVADIALSSGEQVSADLVISCAGFHETMRLCSDAETASTPGEVGQLSFVETICVLDEPPASLGHDATIVFFNDAEPFQYRRPREAVDLRSGVVCCPNNYEHHGDLPEGLFRLTWLADHEPWMTTDEAAYRAKKTLYYEKALERAEQFLPAIRKHIVAHDLFTPRTIHYFTRRINGAVYGAPRKIRDGRTRLENLFICGTDQGFLGIIGAMLSGITVANLHVLSES